MKLDIMIFNIRIGLGHKALFICIYMMTDRRDKAQGD